MTIGRRDVLAFGKALVLMLCIHTSLNLIPMALSWSFGADRRTITDWYGLIFMSSPVAAIVGGLWFLRSRVQTKWWGVLDALFVAASLVTWVAIFHVAIWISGDGP